LAGLKGIELFDEFDLEEELLKLDTVSITGCHYDLIAIPVTDLPKGQRTNASIMKFAIGHDCYLPAAEIILLLADRGDLDCFEAETIVLMHGMRRGPQTAYRYCLQKIDGAWCLRTCSPFDSTDWSAETSAVFLFLAPDDDDELKRGQYLVSSYCSSCHFHQHLHGDYAFRDEPERCTPTDKQMSEAIEKAGPILQAAHDESGSCKETLTFT
jgi:hypothetical protein